MPLLLFYTQSLFYFSSLISFCLCSSVPSLYQGFVFTCHNSVKSFKCFKMNLPPVPHAGLQHRLPSVGIKPEYCRPTSWNISLWFEYNLLSPPLQPVNWNGLLLGGFPPPKSCMPLSDGSNTHKRAWYTIMIHTYTHTHSGKYPAVSSIPHGGPQSAKMLTHLWPTYSSANGHRGMDGWKERGNERGEGLQRIEPCCQGHIDFGRSNSLPSMECSRGEGSAATAQEACILTHWRNTSVVDACGCCKSALWRCAREIT